jgi:hypothetical protein
MSWDAFAFFVILGLILIVHYLRKIANSGDGKVSELRYPDEIKKATRINDSPENRAWIEKYKNRRGDG